jgi:hypothetical protein
MLNNVEGNRSDYVSAAWPPLFSTDGAESNLLTQAEGKAALEKVRQ